jgi:hypothetical protein
VAGEADVAIAAVARQRVGLRLAKRPLLLGGDELDQVALGDVAEPVCGLDEVIAGVDVAGVLERERQPARLAVHAHATRLAHPVGQRGVEDLHVDLADVAAHPLLEDVDQEAAVAVGGHRT